MNLYKLTKTKPTTSPNDKNDHPVTVFCYLHKASTVPSARRNIAPRSPRLLVRRQAPARPKALPFPPSAPGRGAAPCRGRSDVRPRHPRGGADVPRYENGLELSGWRCGKGICNIYIYSSILYHTHIYIYRICNT